MLYKTLQSQLNYYSECLQLNNVDINDKLNSNYTMRRILLLTLSVLSFALQPIYAQKKNEGTCEYRYHKALEMLKEDGDPVEARKLLVDNIKENPKHIDSYMLIVAIDRNEEDYASALHVLNDVEKVNYKGSGVPESKVLWWRASVYGDMDEYQTAVTIMEEALKKGRKQDKENLEEMLEAMAQFYYEDKCYDSSDKIYHELLKMDDSALLPRVGIARNLNAREQYDQALALLDECLKYDKDYAEIYRFRMQAYEGKKEYKKMIDDMITLFEKSDNANHLSNKRFMMDKKYAFAVIKQKIASEKDNALWRYVMASLYRKCHMYSEALPLLGGLMDEYGIDEDILEERAECYEEMGFTDLALADVNKAIEVGKESNRPYYYAMRGSINRHAGNYQECIADIEKYIERYPTDAYGYYVRGWCKELSGNRAGAYEDYNEGIAVDEDYPYIFLMRGTLFLEDGDIETANLDFERVVAKDTVVKSGSCRHYALNFLGRPEEALEWMEKLIELDVDDPGMWYDKSCLLARMGKCDESVSALKVSLEKGYRSFPHIEHDNDMDPIRERDDFKALITEYKKVLQEEMSNVGVNLPSEDDAVVCEVDMKKTYGGTYEVACSVNGLPLKMIFDTGAADVTISAVEASFMLKNGYLSDSDVKGKRNYMTASGDIHEGTVLRLKEVKLGDAILKNVEASVVHSQKAPLLLGQSVLEKFGTITIDNVNSKLLIRQ